MALALNDPAVQSALISASAAVFSTIMAAICAALIGKKFSDRKELEKKLEVTQKDIEFLLRVEAMHMAIHKEQATGANKVKVRDKVREEGLSFSGRFTPGRLRHKMSK